MEVQFNSDNNISGRESLIQYAEDVATSILGHHTEHITRLEIHLSDENADKGGDKDKRCMMEARLKSRQPEAVTCKADTVNDALSGAAEKLKRSLDRTIGRLQDKKGKKHQKIEMPGTSFDSL